MGEERRPGRDDLAREIGIKERRRLASLRRRPHGMWYGIGMFGLVGWAVSLPTVAGLAAGIWLDGRFSGRPSWTLTGLFAGIVLGCANAWYWVVRERRRIEREKEEDRGE